MIIIEFTTSNDLMNFIRLFRHLDDEQVKELTKELNESTNKLVAAENEAKKEGV